LGRIKIMKALLICIITAVLTLAVKLSIADKGDGIIIKVNGDTVQVTLEISTGKNKFADMQDEVRYYDLNGKKQKLDADSILEVHFMCDSEQVIMVATPGIGDEINPPNNRKELMQLILTGKIKVYKYYYYQQTSRGFGYEKMEYILQRKDEELYELGWLSFKKDLAKYLSDCPSLAKKIKENKYKMNDVPELIKEYNSICPN
jgi:hypothetical protein